MFLKDIQISQDIFLKMEFLIIKMFVLFILLVSILSPNVFAQDFLYENTAPVAAHEKKTSPYSFSLSKKNINLDKGNEQKVLEQTVAYLQFTPEDLNSIEEDQKAINYYMPDKCRDNKIQMDEVFHHTEGSEALNLLIYDGRDSEQAKKAKDVKIAKTVWDPTYDLSAGFDTIDARLQDLARALNPDCLPAKFRFIYVGSKRYNEIRYGSKVWED